MNVLWYILTGLAAGILGGMGMGGGVLMIPLLTSFLDVPQKVAQGVNLLAFLPMSVVALIIHAKKGNVKGRGILWLILPAGVSCALAAWLAIETESDVLKICYGIFLTLLGIAQGVVAIVNMVKARKKEN